MARLPCIIVAALTAASCASAPDSAAEAPPAWFDARIAEAKASGRGYPTLADVPEYTPPTPSRVAWREGIDTMAEVREDVLNDPAMADPDASGDADDFARRSRADAARDMERQSTDD